MTNREQKLKQIQGSLSYSFKSNDLLNMALTHRSLANSKKFNYEKFEFMGDSVLDLAISDMLIKQYPDRSEGDLSKMRAALVNTEALASLARELQLGEVLKLSNSERRNGGADKSSILADVVESIIGAIYLESGYKEAQLVIKKLFTERCKKVSPKDPKTELQEICHNLGSKLLEYKHEDTSGPDHAPVFTMAVYYDGVFQGRGVASSKKSAEQLAAAEAILKLKENHE